MKKFREKWLVGRIMTMLLVGEALGSGMAFAANDATVMDEYNLNDVVVTATRTPVEEFKANANVTVITAADIEKGHYTDLTQALRNVPGVTVNQYSQAGYENSNGLYINGSDSVVILIDGVKQNFAGGNASALATTLKNLDSVERIEVLRGSASTLYGSEAKGGVINIITKKITRNKTTLKAEGGSYAQARFSVVNEGYEKGWSWRAFYEKDKSGDFKDAHGVTTPASLNAYTLNFRLAKELDTRSRLTFNYNSYRDNDKYTALWEAYLKDGRVDKFDWNLIYDVQFDANTKNQLSIARSKYYSDANKYYTNVWTWHVADQLDKQWGPHLLTAGFEYTKDTVPTMNHVDLHNRSYYLQDQWNITKALKLTGGVRYDYNSAFGQHSSPSINLGYDLDTKTNIYMSYSEYFITPTPTQLYSTKYGNPNCKPESGNTKEIGLNHRFDNTMTGSIHYFRRYSKDRIGYIQKGDNVYNKGGHYGNLGTEYAHGWDIQLTKRFDSHFFSNLSFTYTTVDATLQRATNVDGYIPKGEWNLGITYENKDFDSTIKARGMINRMGPQTADVIGKFFPTTTYWVWDLAMDYKFAKDAKVFLKINNIFNQYYAEHSNARSSWGGSENQWWLAPGRNFMCGVEYSF